jgi:hypothetical protein
MKEKKLETLLVIVLALCVAYWFSGRRYLLAIAIGIGLAGLLIPAAASLIHYGWSKLTLALGFISRNVLLTVVFIIILVPLAILRRLFGKAGMRLKTGNAHTFYTERNHLYKKEDMENVW